MTSVVLGTVFLWVGWFGFNGGSALAMNLRAVMACYVTNLAACCAGMTWMVLDFRLEQKWSYVPPPFRGSLLQTRPGNLSNNPVEQSASAAEQFPAWLSSLPQQATLPPGAP